MCECTEGAGKESSWQLSLLPKGAGEGGQCHTDGFSLDDCSLKCWSLSYVWLFVAPWTVTYQDPQSMGFSRQEYWSGLPFPPPGNPPYPGMDPGSSALWADSSPSESWGLIMDNLRSTSYLEMFEPNTISFNSLYMIVNFQTL